MQNEELTRRYRALTGDGVRELWETLEKVCRAVEELAEVISEAVSEHLMPYWESMNDFIEMAKDIPEERPKIPRPAISSQRTTTGLRFLLPWHPSGFI